MEEELMKPGAYARSPQATGSVTGPKAVWEVVSVAGKYQRALRRARIAYHKKGQWHRAGKHIEDSGRYFQRLNNLTKHRESPNDKPSGRAAEDGGVK